MYMYDDDYRDRNHSWSDDPRDNARDRTQPITVEVDGEEFELPTKWDVCNLCEGKGTHVNPAIDSHGISAEQFAEDPDFAEEYFRGSYDVQCAQCKGRTTVRVVDESNCPKTLLDAFYDAERDRADYDAISRAERRMGA